ncbi:hypothetical protein BUALT_Bualt02G0181000 [Buddleja alternifolia]|uniref:Uncharacterized protein n=1 Tax=Buddleja alternifolia TaxID=168488 RepID=A0AAV6Y2E1_9LAMI|nr:hypothetical protein BUALT_Bualt02G0181000 [Buddleja alternifolia]
MDAYEATKIVMSRIQSLDPENASKIMGYILIQDQGEKEMIRLAFSPEALLLSYINQAKAGLGLQLPSNTTPPPLSYPPIIRPNNPFPQNSPRIIIPKNGFHLSSPSPPAAAAPPFARSSPRPISYAAVLDASNNVNNNNNSSSSNNGSVSPSLHFYGDGGSSNDFGDEFLSGGGVHHQVQDQLSYFDDSMVDPMMSPSGRSDSLVFPYGEDASSIPSPHPHPHSHPFHRRSCSVNDAAFLSSIEEGGGGGFGWRPCMYFARGFCKNGSTCKFSHTDIGNGEAIDVVGSPSNSASGFDDLLRIKALQQQRFALMASGGHPPFAYNKCMDFLNENQRNDFSSSRQIYLTFPADSTFKEEDVSSYFSMFGPVQDVRIPYQQKRMFGFVTFVYPETVKLILAKGNPHFVCDSRVLVKPYKEKGKIRDKKQQHQQMERGDYQTCLSPSGLDSREHFDLPFGSRMLFNTQEMMLRRKLEQEAELQHAIELQGRRMMNLQLMDMKNQNHDHHFLHNFPPGVPISSPSQSRFLMTQNFTASDAVNQEDSEVFDGGQEAAKFPSDENLVIEGTQSSNNNNINHNKLHHVNAGGSDLPESFEHILPDNLFASPTKSASENQSVFSQASADKSISVKITSANDNPELANSSPLTMASLKSCYLQMPRFSSGQEVVEM